MGGEPGLTSRKAGPLIQQIFIESPQKGEGWLVAGPQQYQRTVLLTWLQALPLDFCPDLSLVTRTCLLSAPHISQKRVCSRRWSPPPRSPGIPFRAFPLLKSSTCGSLEARPGSTGGECAWKCPGLVSPRQTSSSLSLGRTAQVELTARSSLLARLSQGAGLKPRPWLSCSVPSLTSCCWKDIFILFLFF